MIRNTKTSNEAWQQKPQSPLLKASHKFLQWLRYKNYSSRTINAHHYYLGYFLAWCSAHEINEPEKITLLLLEKYQRHIKNSPSKRSKSGVLSQMSYSRYLSSIKVLMRYLVKKRYLKENPSEDLELPKKVESLPTNILSSSQIESIINQTNIQKPLGIRDRAILEVLYSTGIRGSELIKLSIYDIDCQHEILTVREGKNRKDRVVPIGTRACQWVKKYREQVRPSFVKENDEKTLFLTRRKQAFSNIQSLVYLVANYRKKANIEIRGSCHIFRHAMSVQMIRNGASTRYIQEILGHSSISTTQIYTKVTINDLQRVHAQYHPREQDNE